MIKILLSLIISSFAYRVRGGLFALPSSQIGRAFFSLVFTAISMNSLGLHGYRDFAAILTAIFVGITWPGWGSYYKVETPSELLKMCARGAWIVFPVSCVFSYLMGTGWMVYTIYGIGVGAIYGINRMVREHISKKWRYTDMSEYVTGGYLILPMVV